MLKKPLYWFLKQSPVVLCLATWLALVLAILGTEFADQFITSPEDHWLHYNPSSVLGGSLFYASQLFAIWCIIVSWFNKGPFPKHTYISSANISLLYLIPITWLASMTKGTIPEPGFNPNVYGFYLFLAIGLISSIFALKYCFSKQRTGDTSIATLTSVILFLGCYGLVFLFIYEILGF